MNAISAQAKNLLSRTGRHGFALAAFVITAAVMAGVELWCGRSPLGPDGRFGWWEGDIWSSENSQRVADAYSFSHIVHGMLFYGALWLFRRRMGPRARFLAALLLEAGWELLENSPLIIERYRAETIAVGYVGDSVLNSVCDLGMKALGFALASLLRFWRAALLILAMELGCLWWVRDNLTLNVLMLVHPVQAVKEWQNELAPKETRPPVEENRASSIGY